MAFIEVRHVNGTLDATIGNTKDFTVTGFGTPTAAIFIGCSGGTSSAFSAGAIRAVGFFDGTNIRSMYAVSRDNQGTTDDRMRSSNTRMVIPNNGTAAIGYSFTAAFISDGVRITCTNASSTSQRMTVILIKNTLNALVGSIAASNSDAGTVNITTSFQADVLFTIATDFDFSSGDGSDNLNWRMALGMVSRESAIKQGSHSCEETDNLGDSAPYNRLSSSYISRIVNSRLYDIDVTAMGATTVTLRTVARGGSSSNMYIGYLALQLDRTLCKSVLQSINPTTGTGNKVFTGFGTPHSYTILGSTVTALETEFSSGDDSTASCFGWVADSAASRVSEFVIQDAVGTTNTVSRYPSSAISLQQPSSPGSTWYQADHSSFNTDGFTLNFGTNNSANQLYHIAMAFSEEESAHVYDFMPFFSDVVA